MKAHNVKNGTLFDDESFIVRQGTEPNRLVAKAAGLEAFIPTGMQHQVEQFQHWVAVPKPGKTLLGDVTVQVVGSE